MNGANHAQQIVQRLWNYCNILRDDGLSYGDDVEQLTYLLVLKMAHERSGPPWNQPSVIPETDQLITAVLRPGNAHASRGVVAILRRLVRRLRARWPGVQIEIRADSGFAVPHVDLIDREQRVSLDADVKGSAYEGLLEKNAQDIGRTPRRERGRPSSR